MRKPPKRRTPPPKEDKPPRLVREGWQIQHDDVEGAYRVTDKAKDEMIRRGIKMPERPSTRDSDFTDRDGFPCMPTNLMDLSNNELGELYSVVDAWKGYIAGQVAEAAIKHKEVIKHAKLVESKVRLQKSDLKNSADKTAATETDIRFIGAKEEELESEAFLMLIRNADENMETSRKTISRIITLRDQEVRSGSRLAGLGARRNFAEHLPDEKDDVDVPPPKPRRAPPIRPSNRRKK